MYLKIKWYDSEVLTEPLRFVNYYLVLILNERSEFITIFYVDDWIGNNTAVTKKHFTINPEHLVYTELEAQLYIIEQIKNDYQYLDIHYNLSGIKEN